MRLRRAVSSRRVARDVVTRNDITMLLENNPYPEDVRVRAEAESLAQAGYAVEVVAPRARGQATRERVNGVSVRRYRGFDGSRQDARGLFVEYILSTVILNWAALTALVRGARVLHLHNPPDTLFAGAALYRASGRHVVFDHHDLTPETIDAKFGLRALSTVARLCERLTFAVTTHVLSSNESYAAVARGRGGKAAAEVTVVRNGPPRAWIDLPLTLRDGDLTQVRLAYLGAMSAQDGVDALPSVIAGLRLLNPPIHAHLTVVGDGDARPELEAELLRRGLAGHVTFTGWVAPDDVPAVLQQADVCVDPAPPTEVNQRSTMVKIAEYLALGKPVVAYDLVETRRTTGDAALLVTPGDVDAFVAAVTRLARDPQLRQRLALAGRQRAAQLTWEHSEQALLAAYASLTAARPGDKGGSDS